MKKTVFLLVMAAVCMQFAVAQKPNSKFNGVQVGAITYSFRDMPDKTLEGILNYSVQAGISSVELMGGAVEQYAGIPRNREEVSQWRKTVSMDKFKEVKKMFNDKGINIHILKLGEARWSDEELDYVFNVCKTLGAKGITLEIDENAAKRLAPFAEKHKLYVIFHNHGQPGEANFSFDKPLSYSKYLMLNFDVGHYYASTGKNPCDVIKQYNKRIVSIHVKDRTWKGSYNDAGNLPFGEGETPLKEIFQLIKKEKYPIFCDIELEYRVPQGSDAVKETAKCVEYCKKMLQ